MIRSAKIIATLGPASQSTEVISSLIEAGMDVVRQNLSHGDHESHRALLRRGAGGGPRDSADHVPVIMDLMGPPLPARRARGR